MSQFTLAIDTTNDAFIDPTEVSHLLRKVAKSIDNDAVSGSIIDSNGNRVGEWSAFSQAHAG